MCDIFGNERLAAFARELTKLHETVLMGSLGELYETISTDRWHSKGEIVLLVQGVETDERNTTAEANRILRILIRELPVKQAVTLAAEITGQKRNLLYERALEFNSNG